MDFPGDHDAGSVAATTSGLKSEQDWRAFFSRFPRIILVANSEQVDVPALKRAYPDDSLFVFFNKAYKILRQPFAGHCMLVSRAQPRGANIVYRGEVDQVLGLFAPSTFCGIANIRLADTETPNTQADYGGAATGHLDLTELCRDIYPADKLPTSGFALAYWLLEQRVPVEVVLAGFSAKRSETWRVVAVHDWTFEQVCLKVFAQAGKLSLHEADLASPYAKLAARFPEIPPSDISFTVADVLSQRLGNTDAQVDKLISLTGVLKSADLFLRKLRPRFLKKR
ncbi:MAG: 3-deoxy-manno-octulosonate cytidylyltransferase [Pararhizobium sp.]